MANALQLVLSNPTPDMEAEFNAWYAGPHLTHGVETPGVLSGQRFRRAAAPWPSGKHDYLMIWELDDPAFTLAELAKVKGTEEMPISPAIDIDGVQPPTMWRRAEFRNSCHPLTDSRTLGPIVVALYNAAADADTLFATALTDGGLRQMADLDGVVSAQYLTLADHQIRGNCYKYPHGLLFELSDEAQGVASLEALLPALPHADPDRWLAILFRPLGACVHSGDRA